ATTASMPVLVVENRFAGNRAYSTLNEGLGKVLRYGANSPDVIERLRWFRDVVGPALGEALRRSGGVDLRALIGQAVQMGDECHNRNRAASALLIKALAPAIVQFVGGTPAEALEYTRRMYEITAGESAAYRLPTLDFRGTPTGIDVRLVVQTGILPQITTGMAHREAGVGQVGAGIVNAP